MSALCPDDQEKFATHLGSHLEAPHTCILQVTHCIAPVNTNTFILHEDIATSKIMLQSGKQTPFILLSSSWKLHKKGLNLGYWHAEIREVRWFTVPYPSVWNIIKESHDLLSRTPLSDQGRQWPWAYESSASYKVHSTVGVCSIQPKQDRRPARPSSVHLYRTTGDWKMVLSNNLHVTLTN